MASNMWWFYDLLIIMLVAGFVFIGYTRKLGKILILLGGYIIAFSVSLSIDSSIADSLYEDKLRDKLISETDFVVTHYDVTSDVEKILETSFTGISLESDELKRTINAGDGDMLEKLAGMISESNSIYSELDAYDVLNAMKGGLEDSYFEQLSERIPGFTVRMLRDELFSDTQKLSEYLSVLSTNVILYKGGKINAADFTEIHYFSDYVRDVISVIAFLTLFLLMLALVKIVMGFFRAAEEYDIAPKPSKIIAASFSAVEGVIVLFIVALFVRGIITISDDELIFLNETTIDKTILYKYFYYLRLV